MSGNRGRLTTALGLHSRSKPLNWSKSSSPKPPRRDWGPIWSRGCRSCCLEVCHGSCASPKESNLGTPVPKCGAGQCAGRSNDHPAASHGVSRVLHYPTSEVRVQGGRDGCETDLGAWSWHNRLMHRHHHSRYDSNSVSLSTYQAELPLNIFQQKLCFFPKRTM